MDVITNWLGHDNREKYIPGNQKENDTPPKMFWRLKMFPNSMKMFRQDMKQK